jgi:hypothetical protein
MGYVHATIALSNPRRPELDPLPVSARGADSGALMVCIPAALAAALEVQQESIPEMSVAAVPTCSTRWPEWSERPSPDQAEPTPT